MGPLTGRSALVTGASRGIGRAIAEELALNGAALVVNYRREESLAREVVDRIRKNGGQAHAIQGDVADEAQVRSLIESTVARLKGIDILVCNAGVVEDQLGAAMSLQSWEDVVGTNLTGAFLCIREALPHMLRQRRGSIVNLSSVNAARGGRGQSNYAASKAGLEAMTRALAIELGPKGIRVNAVAPGIIETDMTQRIRNLLDDKLLSQIPLGRYGTAQEVARTVRFLASDEAAYVTGVTLTVAGGFGL